MIRAAPMFLILLVSVAALHLVPGFDSSPIELNIRNSFHIVGFAAITAFLYALIRLRPTGKIAWAFVIALLFGIVSEALQAYLRLGSEQAFIRVFVTDSVPDLMRDVFGSTVILLAIIAWLAASRISAGSTKAAMLKFVSFCLGAIVFAPLAFWAGVLLLERAKAPLVIDLDSRWAPMMVKAINSEVRLVSGPHAGDSEQGNLEVVLSRRPRSGVAVAPAFGDWVRYSSLLLNARLDAPETTVLTVHINDNRSIGQFIDLDVATVTVADAVEQFCIPLDAVADAHRHRNMSNIGQIVFLARSRVEGGVLRINRIELSSAPCGPRPEIAGTPADRSDDSVL